MCHVIKQQHACLNCSESASVTIQWDPPSQGGSPLNYTITNTPVLISGPPPVTTSTSTTITISYNTDYTITVTASHRCVGTGMTSDELQFNIGPLHFYVLIFFKQSCDHYTPIIRFFKMCAMWSSSSMHAVHVNLRPYLTWCDKVTPCRDTNILC